MIRNLLAAWRYEPITQTEARARLKALTADLRPPKPMVPSKPRSVSEWTARYGAWRRA